MERNNPLANQHEDHEEREEQHEEQQSPQKREAALKSQQNADENEKAFIAHVELGLSGRSDSMNYLTQPLPDDNKDEEEDEEVPEDESSSGSDPEDGVVSSPSASPKRARSLTKEEQEEEIRLLGIHGLTKEEIDAEVKAQKGLDTRAANLAEEAEHKEALKKEIMAEMGKYPTHPHIRAAFAKYARKGDGRGFYSLKGLIETSEARLVEEHRRRLTEERQQRKAEEKRQKREADEEAFKAAEAAEAENRFGSGRQCAAADNSLRRRTIQVLGSSSQGAAGSSRPVPGSSRPVPGSSRPVPGSSRAVPGSSRGMGAASSGGRKWSTEDLDPARQTSLENAVLGANRREKEKKAMAAEAAAKATAEAAAKATAEAAAEAAAEAPRKRKRPSKHAKAGGCHRR